MVCVWSGLLGPGSMTVDDIVISPILDLVLSLLPVKLSNYNDRPFVELSSYIKLVVSRRIAAAQSWHFR